MNGASGKDGQKTSSKRLSVEEKLDLNPFKEMNTLTTLPSMDCGSIYVRQSQIEMQSMYCPNDVVKKPLLHTNS